MVNGASDAGLIAENVIADRNAVPGTVSSGVNTTARGRAIVVRGMGAVRRAEKLVRRVSLSSYRLSIFVSCRGLPR